MIAWLERLWDDYSKINPDALNVHHLLESLGETVINDHIALRTFNRAPVSLTKLSVYFTDRGYEPKDQYTFSEKQLSARYYKHPDSKMPKVFISELLVDCFSPNFVRIIDRLMEESKTYFESHVWSLPMTPWAVISYSDYLELRRESEYAAWLGAFGIRANHFTVSVNHLRKVPDIFTVNTMLKDNGFILNDRGGEIKGSPKELLTQSSTMAKLVDWDFADGRFTVPGCYYEFAQRFSRAEGGELFDGFIAQSADKIFESTSTDH